MKNLWNKLSDKKKLLWGCVGGVVCVCILVGIILLGGGNGGQGDASTGGAQLGGNTTESTQQPTTDAQPTESTGAEETEPVGESTAPVEPTEATEPTPTETEPEETLVPTEDPNTKPTESETFDFSDVKIEDLTYEEWDSWSWKKQDAFISDYKGGMMKWTDEESHDFACMRNHDYDCGYEGHWCTDSADHAYAMAQIAMGCEHCGKHDCVSLFAHTTWGSWKYDHTLCPEYDVKEDESMYCQECGRPTWLGAKSGEYYCTGCSVFAEYWICNVCGEKVYPDECHNIHKKP